MGQEKKGKSQLPPFIEHIRQAFTSIISFPHAQGRQLTLLTEERSEAPRSH